ncbi:hypothetical protein ACLK1T_02810 [Escherichia coli]
MAQGAGRWGRWRTIARSQLFQNDYSGLSHHPQIIRAWKQSAEQFGVGSGRSAHVSGYSVAHQALEEDWPSGRRSAAPPLTSGFAANQAVIAAMMAKEDQISSPTRLAMPHCWRLPV